MGGAARAPVGQNTDALLPCLGDLVGQVERGDRGVVSLHVAPEQVSQHLSVVDQGAVVQDGGPLGSQYTSHAFARLAADLDVRLSVGRTGVCWDNALAESFFATLKNELVSQLSWHTRAAARSEIFEYIEGWYNNRRLHSSLGYQSPAEYEATAA
ncbi:transposase [Streptomyces sp. NPDC096339]|uniref:transposase n=1 Tax=Streptomyces sp. NPDC096339 TaxID=3366086 RepID=UPI00382711B6